MGSNPTPSAKLAFGTVVGCRPPKGQNITDQSHMGDELTDEMAMAMDVALAEARLAVAHGDVPVGAVGIVGGRIVSRRHNEREKLGDPTAHAEMLVLRDVAQAGGGGWRLDYLTLVVTLEPCLMCAGALVAARVDRLVFGAADPKAGACGSLYNLCCDPRLNHELPVIPGVRAEESAELLETFFSSLRRPPEPLA